MKRTVLLLFGLTFCMASIAQKRVLIYTRNYTLDGKGYVHENIEASVNALSSICRGEGWEFISTDKPDVFDSKTLSTFNVIVFSNSNNEAFETENQRTAFQEYIQNGGSFMGIHSASGSERNWPWFSQMIGGKFFRHPKLQPFQIKVIDRNHPATSHLPGVWSWEDEFYYLKQLNPDLHVLLAGDLSNLVDDKKNEYPGEVFGSYFPLSWSHEFDGGRQFYTALGHKSEYYADENFIQHLRGGLKWLMKIE